jgi:hypothetical protein
MPGDTTKIRLRFSCQSELFICKFGKLTSFKKQIQINQALMVKWNNWRGQRHGRRRPGVSKLKVRLVAVMRRTGHLAKDYAERHGIQNGLMMPKAH